MTTLNNINSLITNEYFAKYRIDHPTELLSTRSFCCYSIILLNYPFSH